MIELGAGDLVRIVETDCEMLIIGSADDDLALSHLCRSWFCVWECDHRLYEEIFLESQLILVRKERRRIPRGGDLIFPRHDGPRTAHRPPVARSA